MDRAADGQTFTHLMPMRGWRMRATIAVMVSGAPAMALMFAALGPVLPMMGGHFGHGDAAAGTFAAQMIMTIPAIGVILGGIIGGLNVERFGVRPVLFAAMVGYAVAGASGLIIDNLWGLLTARFLIGVFVAHLGTCIGVLVGAWFEDRHRARMLGYQSAAGGAVAVSCLLISGVLAEWGGWRAPFGLYLLFLPMLAIAVVVIPKGAAAPPRAKENPVHIRGLLPLWPIYAIALFLFTTYFMTSIQLTFLLAADGVTSPLVRAGMIASGVLAGALAGGFYGRLYGWLGGGGVQILMTSLLAIGLLIIGFADNLWMIGLGAILSGAGGGMTPPHIGRMLLGRVPAELRARAVGLEFTTLYVADFLNPLVVTPIRSLVGIHGAFLVIGSLLAIAAMIMGVTRRRTSGAPSQAS